jgi:hypothetical protein
MDKTASEEAINASSLEGGEDAVLDAKVARVYRYLHVSHPVLL